MSLTQQDNAKLFIMFEKLDCSMFPIKIVLETGIQIYELQGTANMINPVWYISWKSIQSSWSINGCCFYKTSQFLSCSLALILKAYLYMQAKEPNAIKIFIFTEGAVCLSPK